MTRSNPPTTSSRLISEVKRDSPAAWQQIVDLFGPLVYSWARLAGLQPADAQDLVQEVFIDVARNIRTFTREKWPRFRVWLRVIFKKKLVDFFRKSGRSLNPVGGSEAQDFQRVSRLTPFRAENDHHQIARSRQERHSRDCHGSARPDCQQGTSPKLGNIILHSRELGQRNNLQRSCRQL